MTSSTLPEIGLGAPIDPARIACLDDLIAQAEERRVEQMLHIAFLMAEDADPSEAEDSLRQIEALLMTVRLQRGTQPSR